MRTGNRERRHNQQELLKEEYYFKEQLRVPEIMSKLDYSLCSIFTLQLIFLVTTPTPCLLNTVNSKFTGIRILTLKQ